MGRQGQAAAGRAGEGQRVLGTSDTDGCVHQVPGSLCSKLRTDLSSLFFLKRGQFAERERERQNANPGLSSSRPVPAGLPCCPFTGGWAMSAVPMLRSRSARSGDR